MKRMLSILLAAMLLCVAMAPLATAGAEQEPVTLRVTWWGSQTRHDLTMAAIEKFEEKYPYITVEAEFTSWDGYWSKLATQVAGGLMPDVIQMDYQYLNQYAQSGVLADLTPFFESGAIDVSNVAQSVIDSGAGEWHRVRPVHRHQRPGHLLPQGRAGRGRRGDAHGAHH